MKSQQRIALACSVLALLAGRVFAQEDTDALRKQIDANDAVIGHAMRTKDYATLEKFWSPQMVVNSPANTIIGRDRVMARIRDGVIDYRHIDNIIEKVTVFDDIVIVMGHEDFAMAYGPSAGKLLHRRYTNVWRHKGDSWVQLARQATVLDVDVAEVYGPLKQ